MKVEWINPLIIAIKDTCRMMMNLEVTHGAPYVLSEAANTKDISGMIGLSGTIRGAVVTGFPRESALKIMSAFLQDNFTELSADVSDAVGEFVNIIAGYIKKFLPDEKFQISLPSVARGPKHMVYMPRYAPTVVVPFESPMGSFTLEIALAEGR
jgi:chemotaxis protein CheX